MYGMATVTKKMLVGSIEYFSVMRLHREENSMKHDTNKTTKTKEKRSTFNLLTLNIESIITIIIIPSSNDHKNKEHKRNSIK